MVGFQSISVWLACVASLMTSSCALPSPQPNTVLPVQKRQQNGPVTVTGVQTGQVQPRREIRDLQNQYPDQFNVLLLGLSSMQSKNQSDLLSYFQLAGMSQH